MTEKSIDIKVEAVFSEDKKHRYFLRRIWDESKPVALVVSKSAGSDDGVFMTTTQMLISNQLYLLGYGGFCLCNLFSEINGKGSDDENLKMIKALASDKEYKDIIICWGNLDSAKESVQEQAVAVEKILLSEKKKKILAVSDGTGINCHPLSPMVRKHFELVLYGPVNKKEKEGE